MQFDEYDRKGEESKKSAELRVHPGATQATVTVGALEQLFTRHGAVVNEVGYLTSVDQSVLAFDVTAERGDTFALVHSNDSSSGAVSVRGVFKKAFEFEPEAIDERHVIELEKHEEDTDLVVADLQPVVEDATDAEHCSDCGKRCASETALKTHRTKMHDGIPAKLKDGEFDDAGEIDAPDGDDSYQDLDDKARADGGER